MTEEEEILEKERRKRRLKIMATEQTPETPEDAPKTSSAPMPQSR